MNREERNQRLAFLIEERKIHDKKVVRERQIIEILELFPKKDSVEILDESESDQIEESMTNCFPIAFWGRIDWEKVDHKIILTTEDLWDIPSILSTRFDTSVPVYLMAGISPVIKVSLFSILESMEGIMDMGPDQWVYSPSLKYVIEFCHDGVITIGWI